VQFPLGEAIDYALITKVVKFRELQNALKSKKAGLRDKKLRSNSSGVSSK
jgi:hypothetical protein